MYPTPLAEANLLSIPFLAERYRLTVGWSNHVVGPEACIGAVALGAAIVEVHVTDRKLGRSFRDHALSFEPKELSNLVVTLRDMRRGLGEKIKQTASAERDIRSAIRKGVIAARDLENGTLLSRTDLMFARPATEFTAEEIDRIIGKRLLRPLSKGEIVPRNAVSTDDKAAPPQG
jgi:sialic acid synthase SpsE